MDIIKIRNEGYAEYEELLLQRDRLRKEALIYKDLYVKEFGSLIIKIFEKEIDCIKLKKTISFCQAALNRSEAVDRDALRKYIEEEIKEYNEQLNDMISENDAAQNMGQISDEDAEKIKKLYRKLVKMLHPDVNPKTDEIPELRNLWYMIAVCYNANDLEGLEEADALAAMALEKNNIAGTEIEIPNINEKIEKIKDDIYKIKTTDPYQYKYLLADKAAVNEKKALLKAEFAEYEAYEAELEKVFDELTANGGSFIWRMN